MYKVLIADDEIWVCTLIRNSIDWESMGLQLLGEALSGTEAYELILNLKPDIVITDIRMPGLSGLELMEKVRLSHLNVEFIILSGFDNFSYAQAAIKYHAVSFILKPLEEEQLYQALLSAIERLSHALTIRQTTTRAQSHLEELRCSFLQKTLYTDQEGSFPSSLAYINQKYNCQFQDGHFFVILAHLDRLPDPDLIQQFKELTLKLLSAYTFDRYLLTEDRRLIFIVNTSFSPSGDYANLANLLFSSLKGLCGQNQLPFSLSLGTAQTNWSGLRRSYLVADRMLYNRIIDGPGKLYLPDISSKPPLSPHLLLPINRELKLTALIETFETEKLEEGLNSVIDQLLSISSGGETLFAVLEQIVKIYIQTVNNMHITAQILPLPQTAYLERLKQCDSIAQLKLLFKELFISPLNTYRREQVSSETNISLQIKQYISMHYHENIHLNEIAEQLYRNPSYIGSVFKRDIGMSFSEYLSAYRINIAKTYLLDTRQTIASIAETVGFCDTHHFSKTFKQLVGMTPATYRKKSVR